MRLINHYAVSFRLQNQHRFLFIDNPILIRGKSCLLFKPSAKMLRILKSKFVGNLSDRPPRVENTLFRHFQGLLLNMYSLMQN